MGWCIFIGWLVYAFIMNVVTTAWDEAPRRSAEERRLKKVFYALLAFGIGVLGIFILYCIGWIWYFFCGGFLVFEDQPFWDKVICGIISVALLGFPLGFIAICLGADPDKR